MPHHQPPLDEQDRHLSLITDLHRGIALDVHFCEFEGDLPRQTLADGTKVIAQVTSRPGVEFEV